MSTFLATTGRTALNGNTALPAWLLIAAGVGNCVAAGVDRPDRGRSGGCRHLKVTPAGFEGDLADEVRRRVDGESAANLPHVAVTVTRYQARDGNPLAVASWAAVGAVPLNTPSGFSTANASQAFVVQVLGTPGTRPSGHSGNRSGQEASMWPERSPRGPSQACGWRSASDHVWPPRIAKPLWSSTSTQASRMRGRKLLVVVSLASAQPTFSKSIS